MKKLSLSTYFLAALFMAWVGLSGLPGFSLHGADAAAQDKKETKIMIAGSGIRHPAQAMAEAWAHFINKKSAWLRATAVSTAGGAG